VPNTLPPVGTLNHCKVALPVAVSVVAAPGHSVRFPAAVVLVGAAGGDVTFTVINSPALQVSVLFPEANAKNVVALDIEGVIKVAAVPNTGPLIPPALSAHSIVGALVVILRVVVLPEQTVKFATGVVFVKLY
jgi:hypothetical protein